jgi:hypothetical protein
MKKRNLIPKLDGRATQLRVRKLTGLQAIAHNTARRSLGPLGRYVQGKARLELLARSMGSR